MAKKKTTKKSTNAVKKKTKAQLESDNLNMKEFINNELSELRSNLKQTLETLKTISEIALQNHNTVAKLDAEQISLANLARYKDTPNPAKEGDMVLIDYLGRHIDDNGELGASFPGGKGTGVLVQIGAQAFIPSFEEQLTGLVVGTRKDIEVEFPEDYHSANLAGKTKIFHIEVLKVLKNTSRGYIDAKSVEVDAIAEEQIKRINELAGKANKAE
jgi:FKBP-type peptidyl-prolyl cis-trans isomerase (trigger factor)